MPGALESLPWRPVLSGWPDDWRERWGLRANALEAILDWRSAERQAFVETLALKRAEREARPEAAPVVPPVVQQNLTPTEPR